MRDDGRAQASASPWQPTHVGINTFGRLPYKKEPEPGELDVAVLGIPWDGLVTGRPGARFGPRAIREASDTVRGYSQHMDVDIFERMKIGDVGDVEVVNCDHKETFRRIEQRVAALQQGGAAVVALGGDHSVLLPLLRAVHKTHPDFTLIQFDAHTDTSCSPGDAPYHHGTCVRNAIEERLITGTRIFQIGIRGSFGSAEYLDFVCENKINLLDMHELHDPRRRTDFMAAIRETAGSAPCYLTFDIDCMDPAFAPGTGTPVPGGLTSFQAIDLLRELRGLPFIGADVVEVAPAYDTSAGITSLLAATIVLQSMALIALGAAE